MPGFGRLEVTEPREHCASVRGTEITYFEWGDPTDQPVIMLHATGFHARCWDAAVAALGGGYRVIAVDQRGHGRSGKNGPFGWREFGADLVELIDQLDLRDAIGVGHSMGGHTATQAAALRNDRFERLLLVDPVIMEPEAYKSWGDERPFTEPGQHPVARRKADWTSWEQMYERFHDRLPFRLWRDDVLRDYCRHGVLANPEGEGFVLACPPIVESSIYMGSGGMDIYEQIRSLPHPVTVMRAHRREIRQGEMDFTQSPTWEGLAAAFPNGRDLHLPHLTHFIPMQRPDLVARVIADPNAAASSFLPV